MKYLILGLFALLSFGTRAQSTIDGVWNTGDHNTKIEITEQKGLLMGVIKTSDHEKAEPGTIILKDLQKSSAVWKGKVYAIRRGQWYDVEVTPNRDVLELVVRAGIIKKSLKWKRSQ